MRLSDDGMPDSVENRRLTVVVLGAVQFFFSLQATLLFPLGPLLARDLHFSVAKLGYLNAAFLVSACVTGVVGAVVLDSFDRRIATATTLAGVAVCAGMVAAAGDLSQLIMIRLASGLFGGPLLALSLATISDAIRQEERGRAIGLVSRGSALAVVVGVPLSLMLTEVLGWRLAMALIGAAGIVFALGALRWLPRALNRPQPTRVSQLWSDLQGLVWRRSTAVAMLFNALNSSIVLVLAANIAPYLIGNLGLAQADLKYVWALGGVAALIGATLFGRLGDRIGAGPTLLILLVASVIGYALLFIAPWLPVPFVATFIFYNLASSGRVVVCNLILTNVAAPRERGRFFLLVSAAAQAGTALAIFAASRLLIVGKSNRFENMSDLGWAVVLAAILTAALGMWLDQSSRKSVSAQHAMAATG